MYHNVKGRKMAPALELATSVLAVISGWMLILRLVRGYSMTCRRGYLLTISRDHPC